MTTGTFPLETIQKVKHDLRAPAVNIRGFVGEISGAIEELIDLVERHKNGLPEEFKRDVSEIISEDLTPCMKYLDQASQQFDVRIDDVAHLMSGDTAQCMDVES